MSEAKKDESDLNALLCVNDKVKIKKCKPYDGELNYRWTDDMDDYDGMVAVVTAVIVDDEYPPSYDLSVDGGGFGWMHHWLTKLDV